MNHVKVVLRRNRTHLAPRQRDADGNFRKIDPAKAPQAWLFYTNYYRQHESLTIALHCNLFGPTSLHGSTWQALAYVLIDWINRRAFLSQLLKTTASLLQNDWTLGLMMKKALIEMSLQLEHLDCQGWWIQISIFWNKILNRCSFSMSCKSSGGKP